MKPAVRNIIFDFGGVIFNIDHAKVERAFRELGLDNFEDLFNQASQTSLFQDFEVGSIEPPEFRSTLRRITGLEVDDAVLDAAWNEILCDYPPHRIELLRAIAPNYRLFLLSNTNTIHFEHYIALFREQFGYDFTTLFEKTYWSFKIGKRKPDPDPYLHILEDAGLQPEETLFIDDSLQNIHAARKLNIFAHHLDNGTDVSSLFKDGLLSKKVYV